MRSRERSDTAAVAAEFIILFPIFVAIVFGGLWIGTSFFRSNNLEQAAREAARHAATLPTGVVAASDDPDTSGVPTTQWLEDVATVAERSVIGTEAGLCVAYVGPPARADADEAAPIVRRLVRQGGTDTVSTSEPCFDDGNLDVDRRVQVALVAGTWFGYDLEGSGLLDVGGHSVVRYETLYPAAAD